MIKSYLGVYIGILLIAVSLIIILWAVKKEKGILSLVFTIILIIFIPCWLNWIITYNWYEAIPIKHSNMEPKEWVAFLGSYLGVAGTIFIGALAYNQNKQINSQNKEIGILQEKIAAYQIIPFVQFLNGSIEIYNGEKNKYTNRDRYGKLYYDLYCINLDDLNRHHLFVYIEIPFLANNIVPINKIVLNSITWKIASKNYSIKFEEKKLPVGSLLRLLIDKNVFNGCDEDKIKIIEEFTNQLTMHQEYYSHGTFGYDKSELKIEVTFFNQIGNNQKYTLSYFICSSRAEEKLILKNPHIIMENSGKREENANGTL